MQGRRSRGNNLLPLSDPEAIARRLRREQREKAAADRQAQEEADYRLAVEFGRQELDNQRGTQTGTGTTTTRQRQRPPAAVAPPAAPPAAAPPAGGPAVVPIDDGDILDFDIYRFIMGDGNDTRPGGRTRPRETEYDPTYTITETGFGESDGKPPDDGGGDGDDEDEPEPARPPPSSVKSRTSEGSVVLGTSDPSTGLAIISRKPWVFSVRTKVEYKEYQNAKFRMRFNAPAVRKALGNGAPIRGRVHDSTDLLPMRAGDVIIVPCQVNVVPRPNKPHLPLPEVLRKYWHRGARIPVLSFSARMIRMFMAAAMSPTPQNAILKADFAVTQHPTRTNVFILTHVCLVIEAITSIGLDEQFSF